MGGQIADRKQLVDARLRRAASGLAVEHLAALADLAHIAQHQDAPARQPSQHLDRRAHRVRIGVVGVVDDHRTAAAVLDLKAPVHGGNPDSPFATIDRLAPAAVAPAAAPTALRTLCKPATCSLNFTLPSGAESAISLPKSDSA
jgi:hypothetical protein